MPAKAARHKQKKKKTTTPKRTNKASKPQPPPPNWVDTVQFEKVADDDDPSKDVSISIVCWNVLANSYCRRRSQRRLPNLYQQIVFDPPKRLAILLEVLEKFKDIAHVICLQEVDQPQVGQKLAELGYAVLETPTVEMGNPGGKVDACGVYVRIDSGWEIVDHKLLQLDDLGTLNNSNSSNYNNDSRNLQGLQASFLRHNVALLVKLRHAVSKQAVLLVNTHLFWNPDFEYVKLCQMHYVLQQTLQYRSNSSEAVIVCGDLNSAPKGLTHTYLSHGSVNARRNAPWYVIQYRNDDADCIVSDDEVDRLAQNVQTTLQLNGDDESKDPPKVKYLLDASLNKFCRWLRILGQDVALETDEEEKKRTSDADIVIFDRCRKERRTLVTTSPRLMERKECPSSAYCISPPFLSSTERLEVALIHMLRTHDVVLDPSSFLSRCVVCNGSILEVENDLDKRRKLVEYEAPPDLIDNGMAVYECDGCRQGYWWCDRPTSSASRVKTAATRLFELCVRGGVKIDTTDLGIFQDVDVDGLQKLGWDYSVPGSELLEQKLEAIEWLKEERLQCPIALESAYAKKDENDRYVGELIPFTNVTHDFVSTLDYIYYDANRFHISQRLYVPTTFTELSNGQTMRNAHVLPSNVWPSDHLAIGCCLNLKVYHPPRCSCGCVPNIPSLFEMAKLRKAARESKAESG